jgi:hypothetical protein
MVVEPSRATTTDGALSFHVHPRAASLQNAAKSIERATSISPCLRHSASALSGTVMQPSASAAYSRPPTLMVG